MVFKKFIEADVCPNKKEVEEQRKRMTLDSLKRMPYRRIVYKICDIVRKNIAAKAT